jgi:hypothetical protein
MIDVSAKYDHRKFVTSKFDRRFAVSPLQARTQAVVRQVADDRVSEDRPKTDVVEPETHAGKDGLQPTPQSVAEKNEAVPPEVEVPDVRGGAGRPAGELSPEKYPAPDLRDRLMSSVANYVLDINQNWQRGVDAFMNVGRLCAQANARLTTAEKSKLMPDLLFGEATFSKFARIGTDTRLHTPEIQRLLPPHYTTMYAVSQLKDEELNLAIAEKVLHPDLTRGQLQKWRRELSRKVVLAPPPKEAASDPDAVSLPTTSTLAAAVSGALPSTIDGDNRGGGEQLALAPKDAPAPEAVPTATEIAGPLTPPPSDDDIPAFLDRRPLSPEDQRAFDLIMAALNDVSALVRERVRAELIRPNAWSGSAAKAISNRRHDDDAGAQPTASVAPAYTADAAEPNEMAKPLPAGKVSPGFRRKHRGPAKALGPFENWPF